MRRLFGMAHRSLVGVAVRGLQSKGPTSHSRADDEDDFVPLTTSSAGANENTPLGVSRSPPTPSGQEYSRLGVPLAEPRAGKPAVRETSRSLTLTDRNILSGAEERARTTPADTEAGTLPYDDEEFAETILQMEVEGALDETWQDHKKAHLDDVKALVKILNDMRVRDVCAIDVSQKTSSFDYLVVGTCEGPRHIHLAAWAVQEADQLQRVTKISRQQTDHMWEVVPVGRIVVNLMQESYRNEVNVERKWAVTKSMDPLDAANAPASEGRNTKAHGLWTLTLNLQDLEDFEVDYCKDVLLSQR